MPNDPNSPKYDALVTLASRIKDLDGPALAASLDVLQTASAIRQLLHERFHRNRMSEGRFTVLALLLSAPDWSMTPSELASASGVTRATMTGLLDGLEQTRLVERRASREDRRKITVHLTREGRERTLELAPDYFAVLCAVGGALPETRRTTLTDLLAHLRESAT